MARIFIEEATLTGIGDAIRFKEGTTDLIPVADMPIRISNLPSGGGGSGYEPTVDDLHITGNCIYRFARDGWNWVAENYADKITSSNITNGNYLFYQSTNLESADFSLYFDESTYRDVTEMFLDCWKLKVPPRLLDIDVSNMNNFFKNCRSLRELPDDYFHTWRFNRANSYAGVAMSNIFNGCYSLRKVPASLFTNLRSITTSSSTAFYKATFNLCNSLDEIVDMPVFFPADGSQQLTSNVFGNHIDNCHRLSRFTFKLNEDGSPQTARWRSQTIDVAKFVGYANINDSNITDINYNSGISPSKCVSDDETYEQLMNDPDWYTYDMAYSRYNRESAAETLYSLPDTSAFIGTSTSYTNTIKFIGAVGSSTRGGAINTLSEEEIAAAAAKGWTVTIM